MVSKKTLFGPAIAGMALSSARGSFIHSKAKTSDRTPDLSPGVQFTKAYEPVNPSGLSFNRTMVRAGLMPRSDGKPLGTAASVRPAFIPKTPPGYVGKAVEA